MLVLCCLISAPCFAKSKSTKATNSRVQHLSGENLEMFNALTSTQQKNIRASKIKEGYNAWMVRLAIGEPYYNTEHHPVYSDYEQVWLYTKKEEDKTVKEDEIIDPVTNWPSVHRYVRTKTCQIGDKFVLFDRGVVEKIVKVRTRKVYGSCSIATHEEFIPIVDKKSKKRR